MVSIKIQINNEILQWAREDVGLSIEEASAQSGFSVEELELWEKGTDQPRLTQIRELGKLYNRALAFFLLPDPPERKEIPKELRTLSSAVGVEFSYEAHLAFSHANDVREIAKSLAEDIGYKQPKQYEIVPTPGNAEALGEEYRKKTGLTFEIQKRWVDPYDAIRWLRFKIENLGILVAQYSFPTNEALGFCLIDDTPVILVNTKDEFIHRRIFTLIHELAHVLLGVNGIYFGIDEDQLPRGHRKIEQFCNRFAGAFLVPRADLLDHFLVREVKKPIAWTEETLGLLSRHFKASRESILRRLMTFGLATPEFYDKKRKDWEDYFKNRPKRTGGRSDPPKDCIRDNGPTMVALVLENFAQGNIRVQDVSEYLKIKSKHLPKLDAYLERAREA